VVDPLAGQTLDLYGYAYNNPIKYVDPTGMSAEDFDGEDHVDDDYLLKRDGRVQLIQKTNDNFDRLFAEGSNQQHIVNDQSILPQLADKIPYSLNERSTAVSSNLGETVSLFNFMVENTKPYLEFGLVKYTDNTYSLTTIHETSSLGIVDENFTQKIKNVVFFIHNHDNPRGMEPKNQWGADRLSHAYVKNELTKQGIYFYPRFFTVNKNMGTNWIDAPLVEISGNNPPQLTGLKFNAQDLNTIKKSRK
jgi:hypothetical protein